MKNKIFNLLLLTLFFQASLMAQSLENHLWEDRVILLFTPDFQHSDLQKQLRLFENNQDELKERKLVVYQITPDAIKKNGVLFFEKNFKANLLEKYHPKKNAYTFVLVGLDGGEKMRSSKVVSLEKLFGKIDQMPMRKWEMKNKS